MSVQFTVTPQEPRCPGCGVVAERWYWLGSGERLCQPCVREKVALVDHRDDLRVRRRLAELGR